jgi:hypothetical protein
VSNRCPIYGRGLSWTIRRRFAHKRPGGAFFRRARHGAPRGGRQRAGAPFLARWRGRRTVTYRLFGRCDRTTWPAADIRDTAALRSASLCAARASSATRLAKRERVLLEAARERWS